MRLFKKMAGVVLVAALMLAGSASDIGAVKVSAASDMQIYNEADWNEFATAVNDGDTGLSAELMADFAATADFQQIYEGFEGSFEGNGHVISGLTTSMFDWIKGGMVSNLVLKDVAIDSFVGYYSVGAVVDDLTDGGKVVNCKVDGTISPDASDSYNTRVGGIAGYINGGSIENCVNNADVSGYGDIGGIVGYVNNGKIINDINTGTVTSGKNCSGGIAGNVYPDEGNLPEIYGCYNTGDVNGNEYIGGIVGQAVAWNAEIVMHSNYNMASVSGSSNIGGIVGIATSMTSGDTVKLGNGYNAGNVTGSSNIGAAAGKLELSASDSISSVNVYYAKDSSVNSRLYSVGTVSINNKSSVQTSDYFGKCDYTLNDFSSGMVAYKLNSYDGYDVDWTYWSYDGSSVIFADTENMRTYKVTYMNGGSEYKNVYTLNTGLYEVLDSPADVDGSLFAGWFKEDLGTVGTITAQVIGSAADFSEAAASDMILYPVYLSTGTLERDPSDDSSSVGESNNSGFYLEGAQMRRADSDAGVTAGIRFITRISSSLVGSIEALNEANASLRPDSAEDKGAGYGTVVTNAANLSDEQMLEKDETAASLMNGMVVSPAAVNYREYDGYVLYTALVIDIPESHYSTNIAARPYITYFDANGIERTYYYTEGSSSNVAGGAYYTSYQTLADYYG